MVDFTMEFLRACVEREESGTDGIEFTYGDFMERKYDELEAENKRLRKALEEIAYDPISHQACVNVADLALLKEGE